MDTPEPELPQPQAQPPQEQQPPPPPEEDFEVIARRVKRRLLMGAALLLALLSIVAGMLGAPRLIEMVLAAMAAAFVFVAFRSSSSDRRS